LVKNFHLGSWKKIKSTNEALGCRSLMTGASARPTAKFFAIS